MPRKTKKYNQAMATVRTARIYLNKRDHESVYEQLEKNNFFWNPKMGKWEYKEFAPSTSVFEADDGTPTGVIKIRVMAHPDDLEHAVKRVKGMFGVRVVEISDKTYKNRKGSGERIYITAILDGVS